jgi:hypothetical protein
MWMIRVRTAACVGALGFFVSASAAAQTADGPAANPVPPAGSTSPAPASSTPPVPSPAPAPAAPPPAIPPGYMLVPIPPASSSADTRYDVQYPQARGALPPGMELPYEDGDPVPDGYRLVKQKRRGLIIAGLITTGVPWSFGVAAAASNDFRDSTGLLLIPVVGPWAMLATDAVRDKSCTPSDTLEICTASKSGVRGMLVFDGIVQTAGATMFAAGMFFPKLRLVRRDITVSVVPTTLGRGSYGFGAIGRF